VARVADSVCCVRRRMVSMNGNIANVVFWMLCLKVFADAMGWTH
jgi:hypothetical protein